MDGQQKQIIENYTFYPTTQQEIREANRAWQDQLDWDHPGAAWSSMQLTWRYEPNFPLDQLHPDDPGKDYETPEEWRAWYVQEKKWVDEDRGVVGFYDELEDWWLKNPEQEPIVVARGSDGNLYLWDGNHRVGISHTYHLKTVPAWIGEPPAQEQEQEQAA